MSRSIASDLWRTLRRALAAVCLLPLPTAALAGFFQWDMVELPASSGAACGNGTPYRFFVNRTPFTRDTVVMYEGGGACWDQAACLGQGKLTAANPDGIPVDYLSKLNSAAGGLVTPFSARINPFQSVRTQSWNIVYLPYCTGDVHTGSALRVYSDSNPALPRVQYHRGQANIRGAAQWLRANLGRPNQLLLTGFSAGGVGSTATYPILRDVLQPTGRATLLADSGPLFPAAQGGTPQQFPSLLLHNRIREAWGLDTPGGMIASFAGLAGFDTSNLGTIAGALSLRYPQDRFGYMVFSADGNFSSFSYEKFYPDIANEPDPAKRDARTQLRWLQDISQWLPQIDTLPNVSYYVPRFRNFNDSHCLTIIDFSGTAIEERGIGGVGSFVDNALDRAPPMRAVELDLSSDLSRPVSPLLTLLKILLPLLGL